MSPPLEVFKSTPKVTVNPFEKFCFPTIGKPVTRERLYWGSRWRFLHKIICLVFGHRWKVMTGEEPDVRIEQCQRCLQMDHVEGGARKFPDIMDLIQAQPMMNTIKPFIDKCMQELDPYHGTFTTVWKRERRLHGKDGT